jgi:hypothetical protein
MIVYKYNQQRYYIGNHICQKDPISGDFLFPEYGTYTTIEPTLFTSKVPKWNNFNWIQVADNRGVWYSVIDGHQVYITEIEGEIVNLTKLPKPNNDYYWNGNAWVLKSASEILANYKTTKFNELNTEISSKLMYTKKLKKLDDVKSLFIDEYKKNQLSIAEVDASIASIRTDLFEV